MLTHLLLLLNFLELKDIDAIVKIEKEIIMRIEMCLKIRAGASLIHFPKQYQENTEMTRCGHFLCFRNVMMLSNFKLENRIIGRYW